MPGFTVFFPLSQLLLAVSRGDVFSLVDNCQWEVGKEFPERELTEVILPGASPLVSLLWKTEASCCQAVAVPSVLPLAVTHRVSACLVSAMR